MASVNAVPLLLVRNNGQEEVYELNEPVVVCGRSLDNAVRLRDVRASRKHFQILRTPTGYLVKDLGSSNGTYVNGQKIQEHTLKEGDQIQVGSSQIIFSYRKASPSVPLTAPAGSQQTESKAQMPRAPASPVSTAQKPVASQYEQAVTQRIRVTTASAAPLPRTTKTVPPPSQAPATSRVATKRVSATTQATRRLGTGARSAGVMRKSESVVIQRSKTKIWLVAIGFCLAVGGFGVYRLLQWINRPDIEKSAQAVLIEVDTKLRDLAKHDRNGEPKDGKYYNLLIDTYQGWKAAGEVYQGTEAYVEYANDKYRKKLFEETKLEEIAPRESEAREKVPQFLKDCERILAIPPYDALEASTRLDGCKGYVEKYKDTSFEDKLNGMQGTLKNLLKEHDDEARKWSDVRDKIQSGLDRKKALEELTKFKKEVKFKDVLDDVQKRIQELGKEIKKQ